MPAACRHGGALYSRLTIDVSLGASISATLVEGVIGKLAQPFDNLSDDLTAYLVSELRHCLPVPLEQATDWQAREGRMQMAVVTLLWQVGVLEALLGIQALATEEHARYCLQRAEGQDGYHSAATRYRNQAALMVRRSERAMGELQRRKVLRQRADARRSGPAVPRRSSRPDSAK